MDKGAWCATAHGVTRVGHNLATKPPPKCFFLALLGSKKIRKSSRRKDSSLFINAKRERQLVIPFRKLYHSG